VTYLAYVGKRLCRYQYSDMFMLCVGGAFMFFRPYFGFSHLIGLVASIIAIADIILWRDSQAGKRRNKIISSELFEANPQFLIGAIFLSSCLGLLLCCFKVVKGSIFAICIFLIIVALQGKILLWKKEQRMMKLENDIFFLLPVPFIAISYWDLNQGHYLVSERFVVTLLCLVCIEYLIMFFLYWRSLWHSFETLYRTRLKKVVRGLEWLEFVIEKVLWLFWVILGAYFIWHYLVGSYLVISFFTSTGEGLFSYFAVSEYKNFLRFSLDGGNLTVFPIGILTPLQDSWKCAFDNATASFFATTGNASSILNNTFLIESPFQL
jgi:hypothetical protein